MNRLSRRSAILALLSACALRGGSRASAQSFALDIERLEGTSEEMIAQEVNKLRARFAPGAGELASDRALGAIAHERSDDMAHGAPFAHEDESGHFVAAERVQRRFGHNGAIGENIMMLKDSLRAFDPEAFARRAVRDWMESDGHRETMLSAAYQRSGVGVVIDGSFVYATQVFWGPPKVNRAGWNGQRGIP
jgi:uncharacterized protein YkwD